MKIIFFGASKYVLPTIETLKKNFELALVVTTERNPDDTIPSFCKQNKIPCKTIKKIDSEVIRQIKEQGAELGVLAYFGVILPEELLEIFPKGILNIHPSLLPLYRGPTPVQSAILNNDAETGVTIIRLDDQMDHGPILGQTKEEIRKDDTTPSLHDRLFRKGAELLKEIIPQYVDGALNPKEQYHDEMTLSHKDFTREDGYFDSKNPPSKEKLDLMIRALYPWPSAWTRLNINNKEQIVKFLPENKLQVEGGKPMSVKDFLNGYPTLRQQLEKLLQF